MGEAKLRKQFEKDRAKFYWGLPLRIIKGISAIVFVIPALIWMVAISCFKNDRWIWEELDE